VDGNDVLASYVATKEAVARARAGQGPTLIECLTYRLGPHTTADDPRRYRKEDEVAMWQKRDPITRFQKYLESKKLWTPDYQQELDAELDDEIEEAVRQAESELANLDPLEMFDHVYAELTPDLQAQKEEAAEFIHAPLAVHSNGRP
jgi:TPP-dependent pyruvate/acetoin dehydrogenase alpha subunit